MISEWMPNGNARLYARKLRELKNFGKGKDADCVKIVRRSRMTLVFSPLICIYHFFFSGAFPQFRVKDSPNSNVHRSLDVTEGLVYLHSQAIIHGGLKAVSGRAPRL